VTAGALLGAGLSRLGRRSGASDADLRRRLPGDASIPLPRAEMDRVVTLPAPPEAVWPWLVQLGKGRAGWYLPRGLERLVPADRRPLRHIDARFQELQIGDVVPDYGPGDPVFRVTHLEPERVLVMRTIRDPANGWRWPAVDDPLPPGALDLTWAMALGPHGGGSRLHMRVRMTRNTAGRLMPVAEPVMGLFDWATIAAMAAGLRERLRGR